jgi:hypothetical protein
VLLSSLTPERHWGVVAGLPSLSLGFGILDNGETGQNHTPVFEGEKSVGLHS